MRALQFSLTALQLDALLLVLRLLQLDLLAVLELLQLILDRSLDPPQPLAQGHHLGLQVGWRLLGGEALDRDDALGFGQGCGLCGEFLLRLQDLLVVQVARQNLARVLERRGRVYLRVRRLLSRLLHAVLPLGGHAVAGLLLLLLLSSLHACHGVLLVHRRLLCPCHNHELLLHIAVPGDGPACLRGLQAGLLVPRPHLGAADLVPEPPAAERRAVTVVPEVQVHANVFVPRDLRCLLVKLPPVVCALLRIVAHQCADANLVLLSC
mmetsp:Transcript_67807/g.192200  ORF Transcript_67807/g.192200 Transcript_67807/m.192200 type:complete len:266 (-) Transcript_67807:163-960(-)